MKEEILRIILEEKDKWQEDFQRRYPNVKLYQVRTFTLLKEIIDRINDLSP